MKKFYGFIRGLVYLPFKILYPTKVLNIKNMPSSERLISVTNHFSWKDIPVLAVNVKGYRRFIAKKEIGKNKFIHKLADMLGVIFIDRDKADMHAIRESVNTLKAGNGLSIFPEGTRKNDGDSLHAIKGGVTLLALKGNAPIVPMIIHKPERIFRKNYIYIGEPFYLTEFNGKMLDSDTITAASNKVLTCMQKAKADMELYIKEKRWISEKHAKKARIKYLKKHNKLAKKSYRQFIKMRKKAMRGGAV